MGATLSNVVMMAGGSQLYQCANPYLPQLAHPPQYKLLHQWVNKEWISVELSLKVRQYLYIASPTFIHNYLFWPISLSVIHRCQLWYWICHRVYLTDCYHCYIDYHSCDSMVRTGIIQQTVVCVFLFVCVCVCVHVCVCVDMYLCSTVCI